MLRACVRFEEREWRAQLGASLKQEALCSGQCVQWHSPEKARCTRVAYTIDLSNPRIGAEKREEGYTITSAWCGWPPSALGASRTSHRDLPSSFTCSSNGLPMASIRAAIASRTLSRLSSKGSKSTASKSRSPGTVKRRAHTRGEV